VTDENGMVQPFVADVTDDPVAHDRKERIADGLLARETGQRQDVASVGGPQLLDGRIPERARAREAGNEEDRWALAGDLDDEGVVSLRK